MQSVDFKFRYFKSFCLLRYNFICVFISLMVNHSSLNKILLEDDLTQRIIGGEHVYIKDCPYQVSVQRFGRHTCGGTIIHPLYIITAAHCIPEIIPSRFSVVAGSDLHSVGGIRRQTCKIFVHSKFDMHQRNFDIAVLKLCKELPFGPTILAAKLPAANEHVEAGIQANVSGWGFKEENGMLEDKLQKLTVPVIETKLCQTYYLRLENITEDMFCAGYATGMFDACQGDSGGPLVSRNILIGVVSWGYGCARPNYPGVYTDVAKFRDWIKTVTNL